MATELDAINILLVARGVTPVVDPESGHPDVQAAKSILGRHKRSVQSVKLWFNTEADVDLSPNEYGYINAPAGVIALDNDQNYIIMQGKLYSTTERTNIFTATVEGLTLIYDREWQDLPIQAFDYIVALAKEEFVRDLEASLITTQAEKDISRAKAILDIADFRFKDTGKASGNPLMVKWKQKMIQR
jgi:hypothetical protein